MTGGTQWTWKFGSSSPSVRDYVLVPTDDDSAYRIICRMDGGGISDVRTGYPSCRPPVRTAAAA